MQTQQDKVQNRVPVWTPQKDSPGDTHLITSTQTHAYKQTDKRSHTDSTDQIQLYVVSDLRPG